MAFDINKATPEQLKARLAEMEAQLAEANKPRALKCKIGEKGGVSVSGLNARFPVTLYAEQWERLLEYAPQIKAFIRDNRAQLATKGKPYVAPVPANQ